MSDPQNPSSDAELDQLPDDPEERAELEWLLARERDLDVPPPNAQLSREHSELAGLLDTLPVGQPDRSWHNDVLRLIDEAEGNATAGATTDEAAKAPMTRPAVNEVVAPASTVPVMPLPLWRRTAVRISAAGATVAAGAATAVMLLSSPAHPAFKLGADRLGSTAVRSTSDDPKKGILSLNNDYRIAPRESYSSEAEIRIFLQYKGDGELVAMCAKAAESCQVVAPRDPGLEIKPITAGNYVAIAVEGRSSLPSGASLEEFKSAAQAANTLLDYYSFTAR